MKRRKIMMVASIVALLSIGGCSVKHKDDTKQGKTIAASSIKEDKEAIKQKQLAYLKEHEKEIVDFVKSKNSKKEIKQFIESLRVVGDSQLINILEVKLDQFGIHIN